MKKRALAILGLGLPLAFGLGTLLRAGQEASSVEDRAQAVRYARELEANPFGAEAASKRTWLMKWIVAAPDITVVVCDLLGPGPQGEHPFFKEVLSQMMFSNGAFQIEHPDQVRDKVAVQTAGLEGALKVYEILVKSKPEGRLPFLDDLLVKRAEGHLVEYVTTQTAICDKVKGHPVGPGAPHGL